MDRLLGNLENREEDICVKAPEVMEEVQARLKVRVQLYTAEQIRAATRMSAGMFGDSSGALAAALARAVIIVHSEDSTESELQGAWTFLAGAVPRGLRAMRQDEAIGVDPSKEPGLVDRIVGHADKASKLDKGVDAIQEAVQEGGPLATEAWTQVSSGNLWGVFGGG